MFDLIFGLSQYPWDLNLNLQEAVANFENLLLLTGDASLTRGDLQRALQLLPACIYDRSSIAVFLFCFEIGVCVFTS